MADLSPSPSAELQMSQTIPPFLNFIMGRTGTTLPLLTKQFINYIVFKLLQEINSFPSFLLWTYML